MTLELILAGWAFGSIPLGVLVGKSMAYGMGVSKRGCTRN